MSNKTPNDLDNRQELAVRDFYDIVVQNESLWTAHTATRKIVGAMCLDLLGYIVSPRGEMLPKGTQINMSYGEAMAPGTPPLNLLYQTDGDKVRRAVYEENNADTDTDQANPSESSESVPVGDVLLDDV